MYSVSKITLKTKKSYSGWLRTNHKYIVEAFLPLDKKIFDLRLTSQKDGPIINISGIHLKSFKRKTVKKFLKNIKQRLSII